MQGDEKLQTIDQPVASTDTGKLAEDLAANHFLEDKVNRGSAESEEHEINDLVVSTGSALPGVFTKVEKSLASLGFFTPSSRRIKDQKSKRIDFTRDMEGKRVGVSAEIIPSAAFGLPITADQDKWLALQRIITDQLQADGKLANPIRFKSADLLRLLNDSTKSGTNYKDVSEWLDVMSSTSIFSSGAVYSAGKKTFSGKDRFHVFDRAISFGKEMDDGSVADANYVWLSKWQLENMNEKFVLPLDLEKYRGLKKHIAKALVPHLQIWLYASRKVGHFEKRYDELCELFALQQYSAPSQILRQMKASLDELTGSEYLEKWRIEKTADRKAYKIVFVPGAKFHRDRRKRLEPRIRGEPVIIAESDPNEPNLPEPGKLLNDDRVAVRKDADQISSGSGEVEKIVDALAVRGIMPSVATRLLEGADADRLMRVGDQIEHWDDLGKAKNVGAGLLHEFIKNDAPLPRGFEPKRIKTARLEAEESRLNQARAREILEQRHAEHCRQEVERFISALPAGELERLVSERRERITATSSYLVDRPEIAEQMARHEVRAELAKSVSLSSIEDFQVRELPAILKELTLDFSGLDGAPVQDTAGMETPLNALYNPSKNEITQGPGSSTSKEYVSPGAV